MGDCASADPPLAFTVSELHCYNLASEGSMHAKVRSPFKGNYDLRKDTRNNA